MRRNACTKSGANTFDPDIIYKVKRILLQQYCVAMCGTINETKVFMNEIMEVRMFKYPDNLFTDVRIEAQDTTNYYIRNASVKQ